MPQLVDVLAEMLRSTGYHVTVDATVPGGDAGPHDVALWAEREDRAVAVEFWLEETPPGKDYLTALSRLVDETAADYGVLVNLGAPPEGLPSMQKPLLVWERDRIVSELGHAVLGETCPGVLPSRDPLELALESPLTEQPSPAGEAALDHEEEMMAAFDALADLAGSPNGESPEAETPSAVQAAQDDTPFEELPGRAAAGEPDEPPSSPEMPPMSDTHESFEELPGRAAEPPSEEPPEDPPAPPHAGPTGFEELPGRGDPPAAPDPVRPPSRPRSIESFEMLLGREAPSDPASAVPTNPRSGGYQELPGRLQKEDRAPKPRADPLVEGRPGQDFEELPGRADPETSGADAGTETEDARRLGEFEVPLAFQKNAEPPAPLIPGVLRLQVGQRLAANMVRDKLRSVQEQRLRIVPHLVFEYKADVLMDGRLDAETKTGFIGVDAWMKRATPWRQGFETAPLEEPGVELEERKLRIAEDEARQLVLRHLAEIVGREVTQEEDSDEWSIVVKRRVRLAGDDVSLNLLGTFWVPIWRVSGPEGAVEIDAATGEVLEEDVLIEQTDSQLL